MKYYVDIVYIMIVNGVLISKDKNKFHWRRNKNY